MDKFCPKCWNREIIPRGEYCPSCGTKLVGWDLQCECGEDISCSNWEILPLVRSFYQKNCPKCGRRTDRKAKEYAKQLRQLAKEVLQNA